MNLTVEEKEIKPKGTISGTQREQQWKILNWHEKRLTKLTELLITHEENMKTMATEIVQLKAEIKSQQDKKN